MLALDDRLSPESIRAAHAALAPHLRRTPVLEADGADFGLPGLRLSFKLEMLQHAGSFKVRGAFTHMLTNPAPPAGVVAASGGNHGAAVAFAAMKLGIPATIFVPRVASPAKLRQIQACGAALRVVGERYADALAASEQFVRESGAMGIHAFDQVETMRGQATLALELEADAPALEAVLVATGGGGLVAGMACWYRRRTRLVAVEPEEAPTLAHALAAGRPVDAPAGGLAADSLAPRRIGERVFPIARELVAEHVLVPDAAIAQAQRVLWQQLRVVVEPGGAAAFAALHSGAWQPGPARSIGIVLCGANTTAVDFGPED